VLVQEGYVQIELAAPTILSPLGEGAGPNEPADGLMVDPEGPREAIAGCGRPARAVSVMEPGVPVEGSLDQQV
jgi:hypothetical protein